MRIVQIIDSLEPGGAERMAVNYANALSKRIDFSGIISTRKEGLLLNEISTEVSYLFLKKNKRIDFQAIYRLRNYLVDNEINIIHAHSSSFFLAVLVKLTMPKIKIIWHDHYGISQDLYLRKNISLKLGSIFFKGTISVNAALKNWAESYLFCSNIIYLPNFINQSLDTTKILLYGCEGKRIICVANLRSQKNHELSLKAASLIVKQFPEWSFHFFGKDFKDSYSDKLYKMVLKLKLSKNVFFYGAVQNVGAALKKCEIAILPSLSEGLPLAVLEYGLYKLPVVATNVGEIAEVITSKEEGVIIGSNNVDQLAESIRILIENEYIREEMGEKLNQRVMLNYSEQAVIEKYLSWLNSFTNFGAKNPTGK